MCAVCGPYFMARIVRRLQARATCISEERSRSRAAHDELYAPATSSTPPPRCTAAQALLPQRRRGRQCSAASRRRSRACTTMQDVSAEWTGDSRDAERQAVVRRMLRASTTCTPRSRTSSRRAEPPRRSQLVGWPSRASTRHARSLSRARVPAWADGRLAGAARLVITACGSAFVAPAAARRC